MAADANNLSSGALKLYGGLSFSFVIIILVGPLLLSIEQVRAGKRD